MFGRLKIVFNKYGPFILLSVIAIVFMSLGGRKYLDYHEIARLQDFILNFVQDKPLLATLIFFISYFSVTVSLLPGLIILDLTAGFAFPQPMSMLLVLFSAWSGATALFLASRHAFRDSLRDRGGKWINIIKKGFNKYEDGYLVFLRVFPFFPYGVVSIALGFARISFFKYAWTTLLGIIPSAYIFTMAGRHLSTMLSGEFSETQFITPKIFVLYFVFCVAVIGPLFIKRKKKVSCEEGDESADCKDSKDFE